MRRQLPFRSYNPMVYVRLAQGLLEKVGPLVAAGQLLQCGQHHYLAYPEFKRVALTHGLQLHREIGRNDLLTYSQMEQLLEEERRTPQQRRLIEELRSKREMRLLKRINPNPERERTDYYFQSRAEGRGVRELTETISYSMAFIFTFFMAALTGYYVGAYFLNWTLAQSLMLAFGFIIVTLLVETTLFIIKQGRSDQKRKKGWQGARPAGQGWGEGVDKKSKRE